MRASVEAAKPRVIQQTVAMMAQQLDSIPEATTRQETGAEDVYENLKKQNATATASKQAAAGGGKSTYTFNQRAHKKYNSTKSLVERILKSHSEGNRFIRNEDL